MTEPQPGQFFERKLDVTSAEVEGEFDTLPRSLMEACQCLKENKVLIQYMGEDIVNGFTEVKGKEVKEFMKHVTEWEISLADYY